MTKLIKGLDSQDILNMEIFTPKEAREYVKEKLKIGDTYYYQCVLPIIRYYFTPIANNLKHNKKAMLRIRKADIDAYIIVSKKKLFKDY